LHLILLYLSVYSLIQFLSRLASKDRIEFDKFFKDFQIDSVELSKFKNFQNRSVKVFKFLISLLFNKHSYRAILVTCFAATGNSLYCSYVLQNQLLENQITKAIRTGIYSGEMLEILKKNKDLLSIAVSEGFVNIINQFSVLDDSSIEKIVSDINSDTKLIINTGNASLIPRQIITLISLLFLTKQISYQEYLICLLNFLAGKGLTESIKKLLKNLISSYNIIFITKFFDF